MDQWDAPPAVIPGGPGASGCVEGRYRRYVSFGEGPDSLGNVGSDACSDRYDRSYAARYSPAEDQSVVDSPLYGKGREG